MIIVNKATNTVRPAQAAVLRPCDAAASRGVPSFPFPIVMDLLYELLRLLLIKKKLKKNFLIILHCYFNLIIDLF